MSAPLLQARDLMVRFGTGRYADVEHVCLMTDEVTPLAMASATRWCQPQLVANT